MLAGKMGRTVFYTLKYKNNIKDFVQCIILTSDASFVSLTIP